MDCTHCGRTFKRTHEAQRKCLRCRQRAKGYGWEPEEVVCRGCGETFTKEHHLQTYCKIDCRPQRSPKPRPPAKPKPPRRPRPKPYTRTCTECGEEWKPSHRKVSFTTCFPCREKAREHHVYAKTKQWRRAILNRAGGRCEKSGRSAPEAGTTLHAHHIIPRAEGGPNTLANGKALCPECHATEHGQEYAGGFTPAPDLVEAVAQRVVELLREEMATLPMLLSKH